MQTTDYARWFRGSTPYISAHRDKTFVILLTGEALQHTNLTHIVHDLALLHVLGVRLVLVHGARPQIEQQLGKSEYHKARRITDSAAMNMIAGVNGTIRTQLEALFSTGLPNTPLHNVEVPVISGNFVTAQPIGIIDGVDHLFTGEVRKVEKDRIESILTTGGLLLQSPIGYSPSGQAFNLIAEDLAAELAVQISADKLIVFDDFALTTQNGERISSFTPTGLEQRIDQYPDQKQVRLRALAHAVRGGVNKSHLVSFEQDGALLVELFTAEGIGTQILEQQAKAVRP
ncbi:MAG: amino-acid N-acetyltransferase, partial [Gammaproteobacteria bacterium]|nr:amino-acid N-acetyltransferase [Gammaproteobacteria bacterium]